MVPYTQLIPLVRNEYLWHQNTSLSRNDRGESDSVKSFEQVDFEGEGGGLIFSVPKSENSPAPIVTLIRAAP